jgi:hypothetical protein
VFFEKNDLGLLGVKEFFSHVLEGNSRVLEAKKTIFWSKHGLGDFIFMFLVELDTCLETLIPIRGVKH